MSVQPVNIPLAVPLTQQDGKISHAWQRFLLDLWRKAGGTTNLAPITADNISGILASLNLAPNAQLNATNYCTVDSIDNGTNATIRVYGLGGVGTPWYRQVGSTVLGPYPSLNQPGNAYDSDFVVMFNPSSPQFVVTNVFSQTLPDAYVWCGQVHTVKSGGSGGVSGGGGSTGGGGGICFTGNTRVKTPEGVKQFYTLPTYPTVITRRGERQAKLIISPFEGYVHHMGNDEWVTPGHPILRDGKWAFAKDIWSERKTFSGNVYNVHVLDADEDTHNYELGNGEIVHNMSMSTL